MTQGLKEKIPIYEEKIKKLSRFTKARYKNRIHAGESSTCVLCFPKIRDHILLTTYENDIIKRNSLGKQD